MNKYLLETSTLSLLMKDILEVKGRLNSLTESDYIFTCPIVKGEILFGIGRLAVGQRREDLQQKADLKENNTFMPTTSPSLTAHLNLTKPAPATRSIQTIT
ncbi:MAG: hypothetical protein OXH39_03280 [Candidatus Poribacteria bacterium]|nr:hypothetical protein [Candidatus Poribacteria bacterium]